MNEKEQNFKGERESKITRIVPVTMGDSEKLLRWRNDPLTRASAFTQHEITKEEHESWLPKALANPSRHLFIARNEKDEEVGPVRFDVEGTEAEIDISIAPEFRGKGYGADLVLFSSESFLNDHPEVERILSRVKEDNEVSVRAFTRAGYDEIERRDGVVHLIYTRKKTSE